MRKVIEWPWPESMSGARRTMDDTYIAVDAILAA